MPTTPYFDSPAAIEWFEEKLKHSSGYIEYGSGGSTYLAAQIGVPFITIDSDKWFLKCVKAKIEANKYLNEFNQIYCYANIGLTGPWGQPVLFGNPSAQKLNSFIEYSEPPNFRLSKSFKPDLILIDGRFRVSCALKQIRYLQHANDWTIVIDDYRDRHEYHIVEEYAKLERLIGRMAIFSPLCDSVNQNNLNYAIKKYEIIPD